jgi:hypothetical protein
MINPTEAEICKRRGHSSSLSAKGKWNQCKWCGTWQRTIETIEEREDDPPENERNSLQKYE